MKPILYIFSGLPGAGKTTIASEFARRLKLPYFRLDTIEHGLKEVCCISVQGEGYRLTWRIAADNLKIGNDVVIDCVNPWEMTRKEWEKVALDSQAGYLNIEIACSDKAEHKQRVESRESDIDGFKLPAWDEVEARDYQEWKKERIRIDTSHKEIAECVDELIDRVESEKMRFS